MKEVLSKLELERTELKAKTEKLEAFINADNFIQTVASEKERELLVSQFAHMSDYLTILDERIELLKSK